MRSFTSPIALLTLPHATLAWAPADSPLMTKWSADVHPDQVPVYPRPELTRDYGWGHLNGLWQVDHTVKDLTDPPFNRDLSGEILVPYPVESPLSGIRELTSHFNMFYRRVFPSSTFTCDSNGSNTLLHFEAVDWNATVWINGELLGSHAGGYDPFSFDITELLLAKNTDVEIIVGVFDPTDDPEQGGQPIGKQNLAAFQDKAPGNRYVPTSGIWQTVWFECVGSTYFREVTPLPNPVLPGDSAMTTVDFELDIAGLQESNPLPVVISVVHPNGTTVATDTCQTPCSSVKLGLSPDSVQLWSPDSPAMYTFEAVIGHQEALDKVVGSFVIRHIAKALDAAGVPRPMLNGEFVYTMATLDQGFWPDGAHTAPTNEALLSDLDVLKALGYNAVRKHIKVEPRTWYHYADKIGLMVWQDFVSPSKFMKPCTDSMAKLQIDEGVAMIRARRQFGCITHWVTYNEDWGLNGRPVDQVATGVAAARKADAAYMASSGRLVNGCTGCQEHGAGDLVDVHHYSPPAAAKYNATSMQYAANGEFGGLGLELEGHAWIVGGCHGYETASDSEALTAKYEEYSDSIVNMVQGQGLSASVYTQTSDCERECNGVLTYDRTSKVVEARWRAANAKILAAARMTSEKIV